MPRPLLAAILLGCSVAAVATHGPAGDPNLAVDAPVLQERPRQGECTTVRVRVHNTSAQVEVKGAWQLRLDTIAPDGRTVAKRVTTHDQLAHRWDRATSVPNEVTLVFEEVRFPSVGSYRLRATAALLSTSQREFATHDNVQEIAVHVRDACDAPGRRPDPE